MRNNLIKLHSIKAKFFINIYLIYTIIFSILLVFSSYQWIFLEKTSDYIIIGMFLLLIIMSFGMYYYSFLGYLDSKNKELILKKPFRKKEWIIKLEDIINIEKQRLFFVRGKHLKVITYNKDKTDTLSYYILLSRFSSLFGVDNAKYLWEEVLKRKKELKEK